MVWAPRFTHLLLIMLLVNVALAYGMGMSPVFGLIGLILVTANILVRRAIQKPGKTS
jgi:hypothetical protein